jgi:hypothetical protein
MGRSMTAAFGLARSAALCLADFPAFMFGYQALARACSERHLSPYSRNRHRVYEYPRADKGVAIVS